MSIGAKVEIVSDYIHLVQNALQPFACVAWKLRHKSPIFR
jgi:hypothetical protein